MVSNSINPSTHSFAPKLMVELPYSVLSQHHFLQLPEALNWTFTLEGNLEAFSDCQCSLNSLVQLWLFFGLLKAVFEPVEPIMFDCSNYTVQGADALYLTTEPLDNHLREWYSFETGQPVRDAFMDSDHSRLAGVQAVLHRARYVARSTLAASYRDGLVSSEPSWVDVDPATLEFVLTVGETLQRVAAMIMKVKGFVDPNWYAETDGFYGWGFPPNIMNDSAWNTMCPRDRHSLLSNLNQSVIGLRFAQSRLPGESSEAKAHTDCTSTTCRVTRAAAEGTQHQSAHGPSEGPPGQSSTYPYYHMQDCDSNTCRFQAPDLDRVRALVDENRIPLVVITLGKSTDGPASLSMDVRPWDQQNLDHFVAVSHSWAHGFANPGANSMPTCVLRFLFNVVTRHSNTINDRYIAGNSIGLWIDTLCIPLGHADGSKIRRKAIDQIPDVYRNASATFALDKHILERPEGQSSAEIAMDITMCHWMSRLWTLQEAVLSRRIYFVAEKGALISLEAMEHYYRDKVFGSNQNFVNCLDFISWQFYGNLMGHYRRELRGLDERLHRITPAHLVQIIKAANFRETSRREHETRAYGCMLGVTRADLRLLQQIESSTSANRNTSLTEADARMASFWRYLGRDESCIPSVLVFLPGPRLKAPSFSFAPASLMVQHHYSLDPGIDLLSKPVTIHSQLGAKISAPGILLHLWAPVSASQRVLEFPFEYRIQCSPNSDCWYRLRSPVNSELFTSDLQPSAVSGGLPGLPQAVESDSDRSSIDSDEQRDFAQPLFSDDPDGLCAYEQKMFPNVALQKTRLAVIAQELPPRGPHDLSILVSVKELSNGEYSVERLGNVRLDKVTDAHHIVELEEEFRRDPRNSTFWGSVKPAHTTWWVAGPSEESLATPP